MSQVTIVWRQNKDSCLAAFTLAEISLVLFLISAGLIIGGYFCRPNWDELLERAAFQRFQDAYEQAFDYSLAHHEDVTMRIDDLGKQVVFESAAWRQPHCVHYPATVMIEKNWTKQMLITQGRVKSPNTIRWRGQYCQYDLKPQMRWGRLKIDRK